MRLAFLWYIQRLLSVRRWLSTIFQKYLVNAKFPKSKVWPLLVTENDCSRAILFFYLKDLANVYLSCKNHQIRLGRFLVIGPWSLRFSDFGQIWKVTTQKVWRLNLWKLGIQIDNASATFSMNFSFLVQVSSEEKILKGGWGQKRSKMH